MNYDTSLNKVKLRFNRIWASRIQPVSQSQNILNFLRRNLDAKQDSLKNSNYAMYSTNKKC